MVMAKIFWHGRYTDVAFAMTRQADDKGTFTGRFPELESLGHLSGSRLSFSFEPDNRAFVSTGEVKETRRFVKRSLSSDSMDWVIEKLKDQASADHYIYSLDKVTATLLLEQALDSKGREDDSEDDEIDGRHDDSEDEYDHGKGRSDGFETSQEGNLWTAKGNQVVIIIIPCIAVAALVAASLVCLRRRAAATNAASAGMGAGVFAATDIITVRNGGGEQKGKETSAAGSKAQGGRVGAEACPLAHADVEDGPAAAVALEEIARLSQDSSVSSSRLSNRHRSGPGDSWQLCRGLVLCSCWCWCCCTRTLTPFPPHATSLGPPLQTPASSASTRDRLTPL